MTDVPEAPANNPAPALHAELHAGLPAELRNWCEPWKTCLQNVLSQISGDASGQPAAFEISSEPLPSTDSDLWYTVVAGGAAHGEMTLRLPAASGTRLAQKFVGETEPAPEGITPDHKEALEEFLRQIAGLAATDLAATAGGEVQLHLSPSAAPSWSSDAIVCLRTTKEAEGDTSIAIEIQISPALAAALQARAQPASPSQTSPQTSAPPSSALRRLMDVGLDVKLRFGTRRMLLCDVLALNPGVVVELDSTIHSPVDLLLDDGRLIAHGDVVVVDGKYGLRVTDVIDPAPPPGSPG
jgi:flagellar motor switch protein FliN